MKPAATAPSALPLGSPARPVLGTVFGAALVAVTLIAFAMTLSVLLTREPPTSAAVFAFGLGVLGSLTIAAVRYETLVALGLVLLAVVRFEPAPSDFIFGVAMAVALASGQLRSFRIPPSIVCFSAFFVALNLLSAVEVVDAGRAAFYLSITLYLLVFAIWLATWIDSRRKAELVVDAYIAAAVASALSATLALFVSFPGSDLLVDDARARGFFKDANIYVSFLVPAAVIMAERAVARGVDARRRTLAAVLFLTLAIGVLFSYSRAGWLGLVVALFVLAAVLFLRWEARRVLVLLAILAAAGCVALGTIVATGSGDFLMQRMQVQDYDQQRFGAQLYGIDQSMRYPLGIGPGQYEVLGPIAAHSLYVRALAEHGLFGLLTLLGLLLATLTLALRNAAARRDTYGIGSAALLAAWCGLLANSFFVDTLHWRHLWLVAALIWAGSMRPGSRAS